MPNIHAIIRKKATLAKKKKIKRQRQLIDAKLDQETHDRIVAGVMERQEKRRQAEQQKKQGKKQGWSLF